MREHLIESPSSHLDYREVPFFTISISALTFVEFSGKLKHDRQRKPEPSKDRKNSKLSRNQKHKKNMAKTNSVPVKMSLMCDIEDGEDEGPPGGYHSLSIQVSDWLICSFLIVLFNWLDDNSLQIVGGDWLIRSR